MSSFHEAYAGLVSLAKVYLLQEHSRGDWLPTDPETLSYYRKIAAAKPAVPQKNTAPSTLPKEPPPAPKAIPSPPIPPESKNSMPPNEAAETGEMPQKISRPVSTPEKPEEKKGETARPKDPVKFVPEPLPQAQTLDFSDIRKIISEKFPGLKLEDTIPNDAEAKKILKSWQHSPQIPKVLILSFNETPKQKAFLENLAKAIHVCFSSAEIISAMKLEEDKEWEKYLDSEALKLVVAGNSYLSALPGLMKHFREAPKEAKHFLGKVPLCLLSDLSVYSQEPKLKAVLWRTITGLLQV